MKRFLSVMVLGVALCILLISPAAAATAKDVTVVINGVKVHGEGTHIESGNTWVDAAGYAELLNKEFTFNAQKGEFIIEGQTLNVKIHNNKPSVNVRDIVAATKGDHISWDQEHREVYVLDLPEGAIGLEGTEDVMADGVPGMGQHWGLPNELPLGPIYGVEKGKLVFIEQMVSQEDFINGKNHINIPGMKGLPSPPIQHSEIEFVSQGHPGFEVPHFDIHHYFVTHEEHLKFSIPEGSGLQPGHQH